MYKKSFNSLSIICLSIYAFLCLVQVTRADIRLALIGSLTGKGATYGEQMRKGAELAIEDINRAGGILNQKIILTVADDGGDPKQGVAAANKFLGENITWVLGPAISSVASPVAAIYADFNVLQILTSTTLPQITQKAYPHLFRLCGRDDQQAPVAAAYIVQKYSHKKIALVHDKSAYGKGMVEEVRQRLNQAGIREALQESINIGEKDHSSLISKLKESSIELVYFGGFSAEAGLIIRQMREQGLLAIMISGDGIANTEFPAIGGDAVEGTLFTYEFDPRHHPASAQLVKRFYERDIKPEPYTLYAYAAIQLLKAAAERAHSVDPLALSRVLHSGAQFNTILGNVSFDAQGDRSESTHQMYQWKKNPDGSLIYVPL